ncbi:hypothetical protein OQA88_4330 [Cercophora sp. LCS_1]
MRFSTRQFGTALHNKGISLQASPNLRSPFSGSTIRPLAAPLSSQSLFSLSQKRNASTTPSVESAIQNATEKAADIASSTPIDFSSVDFSNIPHQIGMLKALGLDFGWGPTAFIETVFEHIHVYSGMPMWASIIALCVVIRASIFKPSLTAAGQAQKMQELKVNPRYAAALETMKQSFQGGDKVAGMAARSEIAAMNKAAGYSLLKTLWPMVNIPLGFGAFRLFRAMAALPVPGMETGGFLWFTDLTVSDPFFILPIASALLFLRAIRMPLPYMAPDQAKTMKVMSVVLLPVTGVVTMFMPAGLQFYFVVSSLLQWLQSAAFYNPTFRGWMGLGPLTPPRPVLPQDQRPMSAAARWQGPRVIETTAKPVSESPLETLKSTFEAAKQKVSDYQEKSDKRTTKTKTEDYEEKKRLEEEEHILAVREATRLRKLQQRKTYVMALRRAARGVTQYGEMRRLIDAISDE